MFVRCKTTPNSTKTAIQLVETIRLGKKVKQKIIRHFGFAFSPEEVQALKAIALQYKHQLENKLQPSLFEKPTDVEKVCVKMANQEEKPIAVDLTKLRQIKRLKVGLVKVVGSLFEEIGYHQIMKNYKRRIGSIRLLKHIITARIEKPMSKRASTAWLEEEYGVSTSLSSIYRMMDYLDEESIEKSKELTYQYVKMLFEDKINVIFYDCTTLYFESFIEDELKQYGYSKDGKFNQSQVLLAMMVTEQGIPIGYEVFEGSKFEGKTLDAALDVLKHKYRINKVIFTADAALLSKENIKSMQANEQPFIVGARIKSLPASLAKEVLDKSGYKQLDQNQQNSCYAEQISFNTFPYKDPSLKLIVTYSEPRARKDKKDREKALTSLQKRLSKFNHPKALLNNFGYKKFIRIEGNSKIVIDQTKLQEAEAWDGLHGIITNINDMDEATLLKHYSGLWQIEETFRISKHNLQMRPIFHWTPHRIKAHIAICFMALVIVRILEYKVRLQYKKLSPQAIVQSLANLEVSILKDIETKKEYMLPSQATQDAKKIYQLMGYKWQDTPQQLN